MPPAVANEPWTVKRLLTSTQEFLAKKGADSSQLAAQMLVGHVLGLSRIQLYTNFERIPTDDERAKLRDLVRRAGEHEPVQYLVGKAGFFSLELEVTRDVLIPRPDTETLVDAVLRRIKLEGKSAEPLRIADLCTGSGAIAVALASQLPAATFVATDTSDAALSVAKRNVEQLGYGDRIDCRLGDLAEPLGSETFDLVTANPPYIPSADVDQLDRNVRDFEPRAALDGGADGFDLHRRLLAEAPAVLAADGRLYVEMQFDQGDRLKALATEASWRDVRVLADLEGRDRVLEATRPAA